MSDEGVQLWENILGDYGARDIESGYRDSTAYLRETKLGIVGLGLAIFGGGTVTVTRFESDGETRFNIEADTEIKNWQSWSLLQRRRLSHLCNVKIGTALYDVPCNAVYSDELTDPEARIRLIFIGGLSAGTIQADSGMELAMTEIESIGFIRKRGTEDVYPVGLFRPVFSEVGLTIRDGVFKAHTEVVADLYHV